MENMGISDREVDILAKALKVCIVLCMGAIVRMCVRVCVYTCV